LVPAHAAGWLLFSLVAAASPGSCACSCCEGGKAVGVGPWPLGPNSSSTWISSCRGAALLLLLLLGAPGTPKLLSSRALLRCCEPVPLLVGAHRDAAPLPAASRLLLPRLLLGAAKGAGLTPRATEAGCCCCCGSPIAVRPCR
jgi:hypothetical protein